ncbi:MAG: hypothetical protein Athens041674_623 [Parcubacteria group bacterium Athens0416_74]|nr:MAG: hypothetical protein Athens041674_623 [Parcubacteria group bacterium Athens0416_74]
MNKLFTLTAAAAALALSATSAFAQDVGRSKDIVEPNVPAAAAPAPGPVSTFPTVTAVSCKLISVSVPAMSKDKPATYDVLVKDNTAGLLDEIKACNPKAAIAKFKANSATVKVTQSVTDSQAYFKVPSDRAARLILSFSTSQADWKAERFWDSAGPIGNRTEVTLVVAQAGEQTK